MSTETISSSDISYLSKFSSRKFALVLITQVAIIWLAYIGKIDQSIFSSLTMFIVGAYITGNVVQKKVAEA